MSSLLVLLSQQSPNLQTRKGLILTGLQNDFLSPTGKLPVDQSSGFVERLKDLAVEFRNHGELIWVRSEFEATRHPSEIDEDGCNVITAPTATGQRVAGVATEEETSDSDSPPSSRKRKAGSDTSSDTKSSSNVRQSKRTPSTNAEAAAQDSDLDADEELFLTRTATREPCCVKGTSGAAYAEQIKELVKPNDLQVVKTYYSAFSSTSLLLTLRSKLITELYVAGCTTNLSVYATAMDAARYGIKIILVQDCLGYRKRERHDLAIERLVDIMEAKVMTAERVMDTLKNPTNSDEDEDNASEDSDEIPLGASAAHIQPSTTLEVDSDQNDDDDDDEIEVPTVRDSRLLKPLALRPLRAERKDSSRTAAGARPAVKPTQSSSTASAKSSAYRTINRKHERTGAKGDSPTFPLKSTSAASNSSVERTRTVKKIDSEGSRSAAHDSPQGKTKSPVILRKPTTSQSLETNNNLKMRPACGVSGRKRKTTQAFNMIERPPTLPLFGDGNEEESAGSHMTYDLLPPDSLDGMFHRLKDEVEWQTMRHLSGEVPRLVCCQGTIDHDGSRPVYRHPSDETLPLLPWTPAVDRIRKSAEAAAGHELNHALIQLYRGGTDYISEHSDKTLDIAHGSNIVNVSFGAERVMRLRSKRTAAPAGEPTPTSPQRSTYRVRLPHNSALVMSLDTNSQYLHGINPDKRMQAELTAAEKAYEGHRISLTFRHIDTFLSEDSKLTWGQGAIGKSREDAQPVVNGDKEASERLIQAFGKENQASGIAWAEWYGEGSNVLHLQASS